MQNKKNLILIAAAAVLILLLLFNIINFAQLNRLKRMQAESTELILSESTANRRTNDYLNNISGMLAHDLNRTRASLGLSVSDYPFKSITDEGPEDEVTAEHNELIDAVTVLMQAESDNKKSAMLGRFFRNDMIVNFLSSSGSVYEKIDNLTFYIKHGGDLFLTASAVSETGIILKGFSGEELSITSASIFF